MIFHVYFIVSGLLWLKRLVSDTSAGTTVAKGFSPGQYVAHGCMECPSQCDFNCLHMCSDCVSSFMLHHVYVIKWIYNPFA